MATVVFVDTMFFAAVVPLLPQLRDEFELSKTAAGVLGGSYAAGTLILAIPAGLAAARFGVRRIVILGLVLVAGSAVVFAVAQDAVTLTTARFVQGIGGACTWAGALAWLVRVAPTDRRGELIGAALGAAIAGVLFGPVLGAAAVGVGRGPVFAGVAVGALVLIAVSIRLPRPSAALRRSDFGFGRVAGSSGVRLGMLLILIPGMLFGAIDVLVPLGMDELGATAGAIAAVFLIAAGLEALIAPLAGRLSDRKGRLAPSRIGLAVGVAGSLALTLPSSAMALGIVAILAVPGLGILWAPAMAMLSESAERVGVDQALAFGVVNLGWGLGHTLGSWGGPALADVSSDDVTYFALAGLCAVVLLALALRSSRAT
ncbi:MAG: MFS transporter [Actinomycetota bacterium]|nr:MFS transporter [Actinomycetota bacterium]